MDIGITRVNGDRLSESLLSELLTELVGQLLKTAVQVVLSTGGPRQLSSALMLAQSL